MYWTGFFHRVQHLARAYDLHVLPSLHPHRRNELDHDRTGSLIQELEIASLSEVPQVLAALALSSL